MEIIVLRLGHRISRDTRLTTHVALTARAFGAGGVILSGEKDKSILKSIEDICERWGGTFQVSYEKEWLKTIKSKKQEGWEVIHLTIYGNPYQKKMSQLRKSKKNKLIIVGSEKVPREVYDLVDYNLSVTNQPHSEVAALAVLLHDFFEGKELNKKFSGACLKVLPSDKGKKVLKS